MQPLTPPAPPDTDLARLDQLAQLLDNRFRIPGTNIRFGLDAIIGLVPFAGDLVTLGLSGYLFLLMARRGAGPLILLRMLGNIAVDALVGAVPLIGDLFDIGYKANLRNINLLKGYYAEGRKRPHIGWSLGLFALILLGLAALVVWLIVRFLVFLFQ